MDGNRGVLESLCGDCSLYEVLFIIAFVSIHNGETVRLIVENVVGDADERIGINPPAHTERQRNIRTQAQPHRL